MASLGNGLPSSAATEVYNSDGVVTAASYEYGNTFLIVAGLLNMLVVLNAYDIALNRK